MSWHYEIPGGGAIDIEHLLLDINGTLTDRGELIDGVADRLRRIRNDVEVHLLSADTFGTLDDLAAELRVDARRISQGSEKATFVEDLGPECCAAIGNGRNDAEMLGVSRLAIAVVGPEGASSAAVLNSNVVCRSVTEALDLLLDATAVTSTLRP
jgi:soluble P-type ATPase